MMVRMNIHGSPLKTARTPMGIINLEIALDSSKAKGIVDAWQATSYGSTNLAQHAINNTFLDFAFIAAYSFFFAIGMLLFRKGGFGFASKLALVFGWWCLLPGALDLAENFYLVQWLQGSIYGWQAPFVSVLAITKFALAIVLLVMNLAGLVQLVKEAFNKK
jgi:hypothetical protein